MKGLKAVMLLGMCMTVFAACKGKADAGTVSELEQGVKAVEEAVHAERSETSVQDTGVSREQREGTSDNTVATPEGDGKEKTEMFTSGTRIQEVIHDPAFEGFGRLIFPVDLGLEGGLTLKSMGNRLVWYSHVNPERTVSIVNEMKARVQEGEQIFYHIYTDEEKKEDPSKEDTGLFYFRGNPGEKFAVVNAGGGFMYVAAMHDSFPHMQELAERGYNAFALIYRPGAQTACEDLARAIAFIHEHAEELQVNTEDYSLWGGSAGARMAAWLGSYGTASFGEKAYPAPGAVIMEYTGLSEVYGNEPPTYACVGTNDGIASTEPWSAGSKG